MRIWNLNLLFLVFILNSHAAIDLSGIGARSIALGGNYRAAADDWSALYWNPAGMVGSSGWQAGLNYELVNQKSSYRTAANPLYPDHHARFSAIPNGEIVNTPQWIPVPSFGMTYSAGKWAAGLGAWAAFGVRAKLNLLTEDSYNPMHPFSGTYDWEDDMKFVDIHSSFAYKVTETWSVGLGLSIVYADIVLRKPLISPFNPYINDPNASGLFEAYVKTLPDAYHQELLAGLEQIGRPPMDHLISDSYIEGNGFGWGLQAGAMFKPHAHWTIGVSVQYYADLHLTGRADTDMIYPYVKAIDDVMADDVMPDGQVREGLKQYYVRMYREGNISNIENFYTLQKFGTGIAEVQYADTEVKSDLTLPMKAGVGVRYTGMPRLTLVSDVSYSGWSSWDEINIRDKYEASIQRIIRNWKDVIRFGVGGEYAFDRFRVQAGFYTEPRAAIEESLVPTNPDINRRNALTLGLGVLIGAFDVQIAYEKFFVRDLKTDDWVLMKSRLDYQNLAGNYKLDMQTVLVGLSYRF